MVDDPKDPRNRVERISGAYDRASSGREMSQPTPDKSGSQMVRESAPQQHLRPDGPMRQQADRQAYNERLKAEGDKETAKRDRAQQLAEAVRKRDQDKEKSKDRDRDR